MSELMYSPVTQSSLAVGDKLTNYALIKAPSAVSATAAMGFLFVLIKSIF